MPDIVNPNLMRFQGIFNQTHINHFGTNQIQWQAAAPTAGTWVVGDVCFNSAAAAGSPLGWECTVAGTPGTWVTIGVKPVNAQTGTTYTLVAADGISIVTTANSAAQTITIPLNATVPFPSGTEIPIIRAGAGIPTVAITATGTLTSQGSKVTISPQWGRAMLTKIATDSWVLSGDLA